MTLPTSRSLSLRRSLGWCLALVLVGSAPLVHAQTTAPAREKAKKTEKAEKVEKKAELIDLNSASNEELMTLPGVGEATARKIIDGRPHKEVADLAALGVPARRIEEIKPLATVRPIPTAIDLNTDPLIRVETLPGVGPTLAREIIAARPLAGYDDLAKVKGFGPAKVDSLKGRVKFGKLEAEKKAEKAEKKAEKAEPAKTKPGKTAKEAGLPGNKVNLNTASLEELDSLPGIGMVYAQEIVKNRPYAKIEDVMKLKGIKEVEFAKIKDLITVEK